MRVFIFTAALLSATAFSSLVMAQSTCEEHSANRVVATVAGAGIGGVLGNIIAGSGDKTLGTLLGAVGGGLVGNQVTKGNSNCARAYGFYDKSSAWHASNVEANAQNGYYDRDSNWIEGTPQGYYDDQNRWIAVRGNAQRGYRDGDGHWVPTAAPGEAGRDNDGGRNAMVRGSWQNGRWNPGDTTGRYASQGRGLAGASNGHRDAGGDWRADDQPGYYDRDGRWQAGTARGSYDAAGVWIAANTNVGTGGYASNGYADPGYGNGGRIDVQSRLANIQTRIGVGVEQGRLSRNDARRAATEADAIRRYDRSLRGRDGQISVRNEALVQVRLDRLNDLLR